MEKYTSCPSNILHIIDTNTEKYGEFFVQLNIVLISYKSRLSSDDLNILYKLWFNSDVMIKLYETILFFECNSSQAYNSRSWEPLWSPSVIKW